MAKIFVSIASFEDDELLNTVIDCIEKAENPENLVFGFCLQYDKVPEPDLSFIKDQSIITRIDVNNRPGLLKIRYDLAKYLTDEDFLFKY